jgi:hypothetical protein
MKKLTKKMLHEVAAPAVKAAHRYANNYLIGYKPNPLPAGVVVHHGETPKAGLVEWEGFTIEISMARRARVVCRVPTPFSLYTFNYCLKKDGKQLTHSDSLAQFEVNAMRVVARLQEEVA